MEWISVKDRLPETLADVEIKLSDGSIKQAFRSVWEDVFREWVGDECIDIPFVDVVEWKPLT